MPHPKAHTFHRKWSSFSRPALVGCDDGRLWVIKGPQNQRAIFNEQIVARLGTLIDAPVCEVCLVELPQQLKDIEPELADVQAGLCHAVSFVTDCTDREGIRHGSTANRQRFATLQVLYTWLHAGDHQLIYSMNAPHLVYSVDHGHFFPSGPNWTSASLQGAAPIQALDTLFNSCGIMTTDLKAVATLLAGVSDQQISDAAAVPPTAWGVSAAERAHMADFVKIRRDQVVNLIAAMP